MYEVTVKRTFYVDSESLPTGTEHDFTQWQATEIWHALETDLIQMEETIESVTQI